VSDDIPTPKKVLITGAYGLIGNRVYAHLAQQPQRYQAYGMVRRMQPSNRADLANFHTIPEDKIRLADLTDFEAVRRAVEGIDTIVHMAADPDGRAGWESVLNNNITGAHHIFEAARQAGVKRVLYASTNQVVFGYFKEEAFRSLNPWSPDAGTHQPEFNPIDHTMPTRPLNYYACSKVFGEGLAHMYAYSHDISCICLRIGWVLADDKLPHPAARTIWCSQRDCVQLVERCIQAPDSLRFDIFFVQSDNQQNFVDIQHARDVLGYEPQDRAEDHL
jgi:NAD+ dependent glucose-6-phosphate dehydrogenase